MKVLVTGSEGFLGRRLCSLLEAQTEHTLFRYDLQLGHDVLNAKQLDHALKGVDACIHLAAVADLYIAEKNPERTQSINVEATRLVLEACNRHDVRLLFASTVCAYGNNGYEQSDENAPLAPTEVYASSKATAETLLAHHLDKHCILRLATFYGPNMRLSLATSVFLRALLNDEAIHIHGDGEQTRCYTHVEDVANGILCILESKQTGVFNIAGEEEVSVLKLIEVLAGIANKTPRLQFIDDRFGQIRRSNISSNRLRRLGWAPKFTLEQGLRSCVESLEATPSP
jgi:nucleoside-diphosphate-sugar epimerase